MKLDLYSFKYRILYHYFVDVAVDMYIGSLVNIFVVFSIMGAFSFPSSLSSLVLVTCFFTTIYYSFLKTMPNYTKWVIRIIL